MLRLLMITALTVIVAPGDGPDPTRWEKDIQTFEQWDDRNAVPTDPVLFVGSSSIRMWPTHRSFPDLPVINRGFGGAHISDVNHFVERIVTPYAPPVIVFYCGDNDIADRKTPEQVLDDYCTFVSKVHAKLPNTHVIYLPIKPSTSRWSFWPQMETANNLIEKLTQTDPRLHYADTATPMLDSEGKPRPDLLLDDGLHLNDRGYALWTKIVRPVITKALQESAPKK